MAYPNIDLEHGKLIIKNYDTQNNIYLNLVEDDISIFSLSYNGLFLATVIKQGNKDKKIKIYEARTGNFLMEFPIYRKEEDNIRYISFNKTNNIFFSFIYKRRYSYMVFEKSKRINWRTK